MQDINHCIVGFEFPMLDFILCRSCAQIYPQTLRDAVAASTGTNDPGQFVQMAVEQFAIRQDDPGVQMLNCHLINCEKPLMVREEETEEDVGEV